MSDSYKNSKSNYDRWKPGTKLACMMSLKSVCQDSKFYDSGNNKFNSLTWHTVAENLNKEYPDYAKRFTNINVKDRYDRVLKHHKVFRKMANKRNGFVWNPKNFCFELNELLIKQYENDQDSKVQTGLGETPSSKKDSENIVPNELNVVRFLSKPGHIDLEYYHRYIYQFTNQQEFRDDVVINTPSFIEDAVSKGILNIVNKSNFNVKNEYDSINNQFNDNTSPLLLQQSSLGSGSSNTNSSNSIPLLSNSTSIPSHSSMSSNSSSLIPQPSNSMIPNPTSQPSLQHHHQAHHPHPHPGLQHPQHDLDFTGMMASQQASTAAQQHHPSGHQHASSTITAQQMHPIIPPPPGPGQPLMNPMITDPNLNPAVSLQRTAMGEPFFKKPKISPHNSSNQINTANFIGAGFSYDSYESIMSGSGGPSTGGTGGDSTSNHNGTLQDPLDQQADPTNTAANSTTDGATGGSNPTKVSSLNGVGTNSILGLPSGEAIIKIHKEFIMMKNVINEQIINLRIRKLISHEDFEKIQLVINTNDQFIRSAYKRLDDDNKLIELINIYLNNIE